MKKNHDPSLPLDDSSVVHDDSNDRPVDDPSAPPTASAPPPAPLTPLSEPPATAEEEAPVEAKPALDATYRLPPGWARPQPVRADSNLRAWLYFLAGLSLVVALWVPLRALYQRLRYKPAVEGVRDADTFIALAYGGVSAGTVQGPEEVTRQQFEQQIRALRERGFNPIGLSDVRNFYFQGVPLPRKAVLVTMEQSRKNSYLETRSILRAQRWKAVMFARADTIRQKDPSALRWPILRDMARSGIWEVGAESFAGFQRIPAGPDGETGNFLSAPMWLMPEQRLEAPEEFAERIRAEHGRMVEEFQTGMGVPPQAFAFPYGDYGQYDPRAVSTRVLNLEEVEKNYGIGFSLGPFLLNTRHSDPRGLNRLLVNPEWSLEQFLAIMESGRTVQPWTLTQPLQAAHWMTDWGLTEHPADGSLWLKAIPTGTNSGRFSPTTGALTWLVGSDLFDNFTLRMTFRIMAGQFGIRVRMRPGGEEGVRVLFDEGGSVRVTQKVYGAEEFTQATAQEIGIRPGKEQVLELSLNGRTLILLLNGRMLLKEPLDLMGSTRPGLFGLEVWDPDVGTAATQITALEFPQPRQVLKTWGSGVGLTPPQLMQELSAEAYRLAAVSPPWMDAVKSVPLVLPPWDDEALHSFARMYKIALLPRMTLRSSALALQIPPDLPATEIAQKKADGINLDASQVAPDEIPALVPWLQDVHHSIKERNMKLAIQFPASVTRMASFASIAALFPGALIAVDTPARAAELKPAISNAVVIEEAAIPAVDMHLNLYYQLATRALPTEALSPQALQEASRRDGFLAYQEGNYDQAIVHWSQWLAADPQNAEALALIGGAWIQKGDLSKGLDYYTQSLDAGPGQIHMVIRRTELLERMERPEEAREQLNLYARIFPENPDILIAQAQWLDRRKRRQEARALVQQLVADMPMNLEARLALLHLQEEPAERHAALRSILDLGGAPDSQIPFGHSLRGMELLTYPESGIFFDYIRQQATHGKTARQRKLYADLLPLTNRVTDDFTSGQFSDGWTASGGIRALDRGRYELRAAIDQAETYLRLRQSELIRDGVLEVELDESHGFFWLYARRSSRSMLRFGFDQDGFIHLQAWSDGNLLAHQSRPWIRPPGSMTMRLEVRGDGVRGFVNGLEIFDGPVEIPSVVAYGWWGIAPFAFDLGVARARIIRMSCSPTPATLVLVPPGNSSDQVDALRPYVGAISALAPAWFFQKPDGSLPDEWPEGADMLKMFTAFHRIRLLPVVDLSYEGDVAPAELVKFIQHHRLQGVIVKRRSPAQPNWLKELTAALEEHPAHVVVLQTEAALWNTPRAGEESRGERVVRPEAGDHLRAKPGEKQILRELPVGSVLFPPLRAEWKVLLHEPEDKPIARDDDLTTPQMYLLGTNGSLSMRPPP